MKKIALLTLLTLLLSACDKTPCYTISGNSGASNDTLLIFGTDKRYDKVEKIVCDEQGAFSHSIGITEGTPLYIAMPDGELVYLFAEPEIEAELTADTLRRNGWRVDGGKEQALYDSIALILDKFDSNSERIIHIDNFIKSYPFGEQNIEVLRRFLVDVPNPNYSFIKKRISNLGGTLQDHVFFTELKEKLESKNSNTIHKLLPSFDYTTIDGKKISYKNYRDKLLIINFWAAWDPVSRIKLKEQSKLYAKCDTSKIKVLNISLDYDTVAWRKSVCEDSIAGDNVCDGKIWNNELAKNFAISRLPHTVSVSPYQRIEKFGIKNSEFTATTDSLVRKHFDKKEKKKR